MKWTKQRVLNAAIAFAQLCFLLYLVVGHFKEEIERFSQSAAR
jgi:hypothetical protein